MEYSLLFLKMIKKLEFIMKTKTNKRFLTVCNLDNKSTLTIKGIWFKNSGFSPGDLIELTINKKGKITLVNKGNKYK